MATEYGFVYVLDNDMMPGIYKIGFTMNHPRTRLEQLSSATACPIPFDLLASFGTENPREIEGIFHSKLAEYRVNSLREFFNCPAKLIRDLFDEHANDYDDLCNMRRLETICEIERVESDLKWKRAHFFNQNIDHVFWPSWLGGLN